MPYEGRSGQRDHFARPQAELTQKQAAARLGISQPKFSLLMRGLLTGFSTEKLMLFLNETGHQRFTVVTGKDPY